MTKKSLLGCTHATPESISIIECGQAGSFTGAQSTILKSNTSLGLIFASGLVYEGSGMSLAMLPTPAGPVVVIVTVIAGIAFIGNRFPSSTYNGPPADAMVSGHASRGGYQYKTDENGVLTLQEPQKVSGANITRIPPSEAMVSTGGVTSVFPNQVADEVYISHAKGGKQNVRDSGLTGLSDAEIIDRYKNSSNKAEKKRYEKELKARKLKNIDKRKGNEHSK